MSREGSPAPGSDSTEDQTETTNDVVEVPRTQVKEIVDLLQESYEKHPSRLVRAALKKVKDLTR